MSGVIAYHCNCGDRLGPRGGHLRRCPLLRRLRIKEIVCRRLGVGHYVPEDVQERIDQLVASDLSVRQVRAMYRGVWMMDQEERAEYADLLAQARAGEARLREISATAVQDDPLSEFTYYNEACTCGVPACLHVDPPRTYGVNGWPPACAKFVRCEPRRAAYGVLGGPC